VRCTSADFADQLRAHLAPFVVEDQLEDFLFSADSGEDKEIAGGRRIRGKKRLFKNYLTIYHGISDDEMAGRLISGVRDMVTSYTDQHLRLRAAAVEVDDRIVLLPSEPNPHLPALAAALTRAGAAYLGDEIVYLDPVLRHAHPIASDPLPVLLDSADLGDFPDIPRKRGRKNRTRRSSKPSAVTDRVPVRVEELGGTGSKGGPVGLVVFPSFAPDQPSTTRPSGRSEALFGLTGALLNPEIWTDRAMLVLRDLVADTPAHHLTVGNYEEAAGAVIDLARGSGGGDR
jgi:hypothetical protein